MNIVLVGMGMGTAATLTMEARDALVRADVVIGSGRLLAAVPKECEAEKIVQAVPEKVAALIEAHPGWNEVRVVLSGDVGFYSGAKRLQELLGRRISRRIPGVSVPQYFAAKLGRPWQDFRLVSAHGVRRDILAEALGHPAVLFLTGGEITPSSIAAALVAAGLDEARLTIGENLSYPDERIVAASAGELNGGPAFAPLCVVLVENDSTFARDIRSPGIPDEEFVRGGTPMTKREIRVQALSLLRLRPDDVVYDVGAGTGSVSVETALLARRGRVYAVENDAEAFELIKANRERFGVYNLEPIFGVAPEALALLPPPAAAFVGGSGGRMRAIVEAVLGKNPKARLVISAIALENLFSAQAALTDLAASDIAVTQISASRTVVRRGYHMLEARNPVFLISGGGA